MNILYKTKTYLCGHMQYVNGEGWRQKVTTRLEPMGIQCFNPYDKPFVEEVDEGPSFRKTLSEKLKDGDFDFVQEKLRKIRIYDLNLVDRSDFIIAHIYPTISSWGSAEELVTAVRAKKPIFLSVEGGKKECPLWIFGMFPHKYIYDSIDDVLTVIDDINSGKIETDSNRWRLLKPEYR